MKFRITGTMKGQGLGTRVVSVKGPEHGLELTLRQSVPGEEYFEAGQILCECSSDREMPAAFSEQASPVQGPPAGHPFTIEVRRELKDFVNNVIRIIRWRRGLLGSGRPVFYRRSFEWSADGREWNKADGGQVRLAFDAGIPYAKWSDEVDTSVAELVLAGATEPIAHELLCEAELNVVRSPRSAVVMAVAAAKIGVNQLIEALAPVVKRRKAPPLDTLLTKHLPHLRPKARIGGQDPFVPRTLRKRIAKAAKCRNEIVHLGYHGVSAAQAREAVTAVHDLLYILDVYAGNLWALGNVTVPTLEELKVELTSRTKKPKMSE